MIQVYKILHSEDESLKALFNIDTITRGHKCTLKKPFVKNKVQKHFFSIQMINDWNSLIFVCIILLLYIKFADRQRLRSSRSEVFLHRYFSRILPKNFKNNIFLHFQNLGVAVFKKHLSVAAFKVINIHSLFSIIFILLVLFMIHIVEHFLFIVLSLHSLHNFMSMFMMAEQAL